MLIIRFNKYCKQTYDLIIFSLIPDSCFYWVSRIYRNLRQSKNGLTISTNSSLWHSELHANHLEKGDVKSIKSTNLISEKQNSFDKRGRSKIPIRIEGWSRKTTSILATGPEDINPHDDNLRMKLEWVIRRLEHIERIQLSEKEITE